VSYNLAALHQSGRFGITLPENSSATNGSVAQIRWCDWLAVALANGKHIAPFDPFVPTSDRDLAIQQAISRLGTTSSSQHREGVEKGAGQS
jgi:hypothetical protein